MTTSPVIETNQSHTWKWVSGILAAALALIVAGMAVESYFFYKVAHDLAPGWPTLSHRVPNPGGPTLDSGPGILDDSVSPSAVMAREDPWDQMNRLHQQMDQLFNATLSQAPLDDATLMTAVSSPNLDVREEKDHYTVRVDMPGANKDSIKVNVEGRLLTVSGERTSVNETKDDDKVVRSERSMAEFVRTLELPGPVNAEAVNAKYDNGVLTLNLPKANQSDSSTNVPIH